MRRTQRPKQRPNHTAGQSEKRPVSCLFCRSRKLRCTREFPCSNCLERGITCELRPASQVSSVKSPITASPNTSEVSQTEILQRLQRLEEIVVNSNKRHGTFEGAESGEVLSSQAPTRSETCSSTPPKFQPLTADIARLEKVALGESFSGSLSPDGITFMVCPIRQIPSMSRYIHPATESQSISEPTRCVWLPQYDETKVMLEKYVTNITYIHHVIHIPTLSNVLSELYVDLNCHAQINPGHIALLLSILASTTFSWTAIDCDGSLFSTPAEAHSQTTLWVKATQDVLEYSHRTTCVSLEAIQSMIIVSFLVCELEGLAQRFRLLFASAITMAREMNLHRTEESKGTVEPGTVDTVQAEIGRRVWWHLVATDWMLSRFPGPCSGVYVCNPSQMAVNKPRNADDEDLVDGMGKVERPLSQPTAMSYFLERVRLAELCRNFTDQTPFVKFNDETSKYSDAMDSDSKILAYVDQMPVFFRLDRESHPDFTKPDISKVSSITIQRYMLNSLIQIQCCKLHLPYLIRGTVEPAYSYSYQSCVNASRLIIENEKQLEKEHLPFVHVRLRFSPGLYGVAMAGIVLLLDQCLRNTAGQKQDTRPEELTAAFRILGEARELSSTAARLLESMIQVLRKHKIATPETDTHSWQQTGREEVSNAGLAVGQNSYIPLVWQNESIQSDQGLSSYFDGALQDLGPQIDFDALDWNSILPELDIACI